MKKGDRLTAFGGRLPRKKLVGSIGYGCLRVLISAAWPLLLYKALRDIGTSGYPLPSPQLLAVPALLIIAAFAARFQSNANIGLLKAFSLDLTGRIWRKMNALDWLSFHRNSRVYYFDLLMTESWRMRAGLSALLDTLIISSLVALTLSIFIAYISWPFFLVCLAGLVLIGGGSYLAMIRTRPVVNRFHHAWRAQHHWIATTVDQYDLVRLDRGYAASEAKHRHNTAAFLEANSVMLRRQAYWRTANQLLGNMVRVAVFAAGIYWMQAGYIAPDQLLLLLLLAGIIQANAMQIPGALGSLLEAQEARKAVQAFLALADEQSGPLPDLPEPEQVRTMTVQGIGFRYDQQPLLTMPDLHLERGRIYLWKGHNGSGKTTTAQILLGLLHPENGTLHINGKPAGWESLRQLRSRFCYLYQDSPVFTGSLKENILFGHPDPVSAWETMQKSWLAGLVPFARPDGARQVGQRGEGLSGGEAKRIALVRELLRTSELLILDEPLNHLDDYAIRELQRELILLREHTIIVIVSHQKGFEDIADEICTF